MLQEQNKSEGRERQPLSAQGRQKRVSCPLELELPKVVSFHVALRREPRSSARATTALKHRGVSPDSSPHHSEEGIT
ncbi:hypothetical protein LEMLEM_LOCUS22137, partial [Lemmus lemmus]